MNRNPLRASRACLPSLFALACLVPVAGAANPLTLDDVLALEEVAAPRLSPEGDWIAYTVEHVDAEKDEASTAVYMVSVADGAVVPMTRRDRPASEPRFSPDGRHLAFLAPDGDDDDAKTQVFTLDRRGGEARRYTNVPQGVADYRWSPDGERMLLVIRDMSEQERVELEAAEAKEEAKPIPWVIDRLQFKQDGVTYLDRNRTHLYLLSERDGEPVQLTFGDYDDTQPAWSPDGTAIAFVSNRTEEPDANDNSDVWVVPATPGDAPPRRITTNPGADHSPAWSHDGRRIAYVTVTEPELIWYATNHLALVGADGRGQRLLTAALDRNVRLPRFAPDDRSILFILEDSAEQHLASFDLDDGGVDRPVRGELSVADYHQAPSGRIALLISTPHAPHDVFVLDDGVLEKLTATNAPVLDGVELGAVRNVTYPSRDGTAIEGFIVTPPGYQRGRRYPTLLRIHGGPVSQYDFAFNEEAQLFAAHGYVVLLTNPRGSSGYGQAFSRVLWAQWGVKDLEDVLAGVDYAIDEGYADPDRLGVGGWSYGGILTNYVITKSDRFAGAISGASEVLYVANYGHDHYQHEWEKELGLPWENREAWEAISPFNDVANVTTPTLIMGGKEDWNVPINNSEQLYQALKRRGVDTQLVVYPGEDHGISRPSFVRDRYQRYLGWYDRTVRGEASAEAASL